MKQRKVPKKNIDSVLVDVRKPNFNYERSSRVRSINLSRIPQAPISKFREFKKKVLKVLGIAAVAVAAIAAFVILTLRSAGDEFVARAGLISENFSRAAVSIEGMELREAEDILKENRSEIRGLRDLFEDKHGVLLSQVFGAFTPPIGKVEGLLGDIHDLNENFLKVAVSFRDATENGFRYFRGGGLRLLSALDTVESSLGNVLGKMESIRNTVAELKAVSSLFGDLEASLSERYLKYGADLQDTRAFVRGVRDIVGSLDERHVAILFQNAAEIRPGGGFVGSYGDMVVQGGEMVSLDVRDIYDPDGQLDIEVTPPYEIRTMSRDWGARDANWFFDFPTSAEAVLYFLESSKIYAERDVTFDAVVGLNTHVLESVLDVTGPVDLEGYGEINAENFHEVIQYEVEAGEDKEEGQPKRILGVLAPVLMERLEALDGKGREDLVSALGGHAETRDVMVYARDERVAHFLSERNLDGGVYDLPNGFLGSYLAVVNANIAGGKTDVFMEQEVDARIDLNTNGGVFTDLSVIRRHAGENERDPWWRATNRNFMQIYTNPGSNLVSVKGSQTKSIVSRFDYEAQGYEFYEPLQKIEDSRIYVGMFDSWTMQAFGKSVFATWFNVAAGDEETLEMRYESPGKENTVVAPGEVFTFIFERQSGANTSLRADISAPLGYEWEESGSPFFVYETPDPRSREVIELTLARQET